MTGKTKLFGWLGFSAIAAVITMIVSTAARASTNYLAEYELGEADTSAAANTPPLPGDGGGAVTVDSSGHGFNLTETGSPIYSPNAAPVDSSTLSVQFNAATSDDYYSRPSLVPANTGVVFEAWAYPTAADVAFDNITHTVLIAGDYVITTYQTQWSFLEQNQAFNFAGSVVPNQWADLKLIIDNGTVQAYINGVLVVTNSTDPQPYNPVGSPSGAFSIGGGFNGEIDEVTVQVPEPASASLLLVSGLGLMGLRRRR